MSKAFSVKLDESIASIADDESVCTLRAVVKLNPSRFMKKPFLHHNDAKVNDDFTSKRKQGILDDLPNPKQTLSIINIISFTQGTLTTWMHLGKTAAPAAEMVVITVAMAPYLFLPLNPTSTSTSTLSTAA